MTTREFRTYRQVPVPELRSEDGVVTLEAYAAVFNRYSQNLGGFVEEIEPGAFTDVLTRSESLVGLYNHDASSLLGTVASNTLFVTADEIGLRYAIPLDMEDPDGVRVAAKARTGKLRGSSFSFSASNDGVEWRKTDNGFPLRSIRSFSGLYDVGPVTFPAYKATEDGDLSVALRSLADATGHSMATLIEAARSEQLTPLLTAPETETEEVEDEGTPTTTTEDQTSRSASVRRWTATTRNT